MRISIYDAMEITKKHIISLPIIKKPLMECLNDTLAMDIIAPINQPPFQRSAMDGYAIKQTDFIKGKRYEVICEIDAGDTNDYDYIPDKVYRIMTGARVPQGYDLIIPQEMTDYGEKEVIIFDKPNRDNICPIGEDYKEKDILVKKETILHAPELSCIASCGIPEIQVYDKLKVAIITTGSELVGIDETLIPGQIYDSNSAYIYSRLIQSNCNVIFNKRIKDDKEDIKAAFIEASKCSDYIITLGGVSVGNKDLIEKCLLELNAEVQFHGITIKPGMPTMFSLLDDIPVLSLSGNPFASSSLFEYLFPYVNNIDVYANLENSYKKNRPNLRVVRGYIDLDKVHIFTNQHNGSVSSGVTSNCLVELPLGNEPLEVGTKVKVKIIR